MLLLLRHFLFSGRTNLIASSPMAAMVGIWDHKTNKQKPFLKSRQASCEKLRPCVGVQCSPWDQNGGPKSGPVVSSREKSGILRITDAFKYRNKLGLDFIWILWRNLLSRLSFFGFHDHLAIGCRHSYVVPNWFRCVCPPFAINVAQRCSATARDDVDRSSSSRQVVTGIDFWFIFDLMGSFIVVVMTSKEKVNSIRYPCSYQNLDSSLLIHPTLSPDHMRA